MTSKTGKGLARVLAVVVGLAFIGASAQPAKAQNKPQKAAPTKPSENEAQPGIPNKLPKVTADCEFFRTIHDWKALDPYNLIVWFNSRNTPWHLELETACYQLRFVDVIAFTSTDNRLCAFAGDSVIAGDELCEIGAMNRITPKQAKALVAKFEKARTSHKSKTKKAGKSGKQD